MDAVRWGKTEALSDEMETITGYLTTRNETIAKTIGEWRGRAIDGTIELQTGECVAETYVGLPITWDAWEGGFEFLSCEALTEDTFFQGEKEYRFRVTVAPNYDGTFEEGVRFLATNGTVESQELGTDGEMTLTVNVGVPRQKSTVYQGVDFDLVYDKDYYLKAHPEIEALVGTDDMAVLQYFVENGISRGDQACADFSVQAYLDRYYETLATVIGEDYRALVEHYLLSGYANGWSGKP